MHNEHGRWAERRCCLHILWLAGNETVKMSAACSLFHSSCLHAGKHLSRWLHWQEGCAGRVSYAKRSTSKVRLVSLSKHMHNTCRQKWLAVVSLDRSESTSEPKALRKLARQNKYEIKAVLWNPHHSQQDLLASTVSKKLLVTSMDHCMSGCVARGLCRT